MYVCRMSVTDFLIKAFARCCAPTGPILFEERFSFVSICVKTVYHEMVYMNLE